MDETNAIEEQLTSNRPSRMLKMKYQHSTIMKYETLTFYQYTAILLTVLINVVWIYELIQIWVNETKEYIFAGELGLYGYFFMVICGVMVFYSLAQLYFLGVARRQFFMSLYKFIYPLLITVKYTLYFFFMDSLPGDPFSPPDEDQRHVHGVVIAAGCSIEVFCMLSIVLLGVFIEKIIKRGVSMKVFVHEE